MTEHARDVPRRRWIRRGSAALALGIVCGTLTVGCAASTSADAALPLAPPSAGAAPAPVPVSAPAAAPASDQAAPLREAARPVGVRVTSLRIDAALDPLHRDADGVLVPPEYGRAGWYEAGPEPGEAGRAVIAGHVDSKTGPDVFYGLSRARAGDRISVPLADGSVLTFVVDSVGLYPRDDFPTERVYGGPQRRAELRLITCGGPYVRSRGGYQDNVVVFAHLLRRHG